MTLNNGTGDVRVAAGVRHMIKAELNKVMEDDILAAARELMEEQRNAIQFLLDEQRKLIKEVLEEEKLTTRGKIDEFRRTISRMSE